MTHPILVLNNDHSPISQLPLSTVKWEDAVRAIFLETVIVIAEYDDWDVHSPSITMRVPSIIMTKRYLHFNRKVSFMPEQIFLRDKYTCQYCYKSFPPSKLTMDHVLPEHHGGKKSWENIATACGPCNVKKGSNKRIVPKVMPRKPTYYELINIRKQYPLAIPCREWVDYLDWPEENLIINDKKILRDTDQV